MGAIISRFKSKKDTYHVLEDIDKNLTSLEQFNKLNQERRKKIIKRLVFTSVILYIIGAVSLYFFFMPEKLHHRLYGSIPFLCFPFLVYFLKQFLHWYFVRKITQNELEMQDLRSQRKEILENVMEKETYKRAKEILEKFDPETKKKLEEDKRAKEDAERITTLPSTPDGLRKRSQTQRGNISVTPQMHIQQNNNGQGPAIITSRVMTPALPRPILPPKPSPMDKVLNYLVGDGVEQRYALICKNCYNHNGMAMRGEFEYMAYRCAYCRFFNPARKQRPNAPRLIDMIPSTPLSIQPVHSTSSNTSSETESTPSRSTAQGDDDTTTEPKILEFTNMMGNSIMVLDDIPNKDSNAQDDSKISEKGIGAKPAKVDTSDNVSGEVEVDK